METKLIGYVVNIWDPLNYQVHLNLPDQYQSRIHNEPYTYCEDVVTPSGVIRSEPKTGYVYRCRLKNLKTINTWSKDYKDLLQEVTNRIDRQNGWIVCKPIQIDKYDRLIVDMYDPITLDNFYDIILKYPTVVEKYY